MTLMNAHSLFLGSRQTAAYHEAISPCSKAHEELVVADKKIRTALRLAAEEISKSRHQRVAMASRQYIKDHNDLIFDLRFLWQGSKVYKTDIDPAFKPPQQIDLDVGIYLRTSFFGTTEPAVASGHFFTFIEKELARLCKREGWTLITTKNTCVRIEIDSEKHIDLPLYAIPDDEFLKVEMAAKRAFGEDLSLHGRNILSMLDGETSLRIRQDRVMLAHRKKGWIVSDPRALHDWFEERTTKFGPQLKRCCRYVKAWRDFVFPKGGGPESITLMVCVVKVFEEFSVSFQDNRDDLTFLEIARRLEDLFRSDIENPILPGTESKLNNWNDVERQLFINKAVDLYDKAGQALEGTHHTSITVERFVEALGDRFSQRPDLVKSDFETKSGVATPAIVAQIIPVRSTTSG